MDLQKKRYQWLVGGYESSGRKAKALLSKKLAEHFCQLKYGQLNSDVFTGLVLAEWNQMIGEYREAKKVQGVTEGTLYEIALSLRNFERLVGKCRSKQLTQNVMDKFILERGTEVSRPTLNKDIRNLKTFINWCKKKRYINNQIELRELKEEEKPVRSLNDAEIKTLLKATEQDSSMKKRVLLALATGLRRGDIDSLEISDIDFEKNSIATSSRKTKKSMASRPVSAEIMAEPSNYVCGLNVGQEKLFKTTYNHRKWR